MDVLQKLTLRTMKLNRKRTLVTIIGIVLATALLTAVANVAESFRASMIEYEKNSSGDFHYAFMGVPEESWKYFQENRSVEKLGYAQELGYVQLPDCQNEVIRYLCLTAMEENAMRAAAIHVKAGRLPEKEGEIVVSNLVRLYGGVDIKLGDKLTLTVGDRKVGDRLLGRDDPYQPEEEFSPRQELEFEVVGLVSYRSYSYYSEGNRRAAPYYMATAWANPQEMSGQADLFATYTKAGLKRAEDVTAGLMKTVPMENQKVIGNRSLIRYELNQFSNRTMSMLYSMAFLAILVIVAASVSCIRNSFTISLTEKIRLYGMLSSVGTTRKQIRRLVHLEAFWLGLLGIPLGTLCGVLASRVVIGVTGRLIVDWEEDLQLVYVFSLPAMVLGGVMAAVTIYLSAGRSARRASQISPISAIRGNEGVRISRWERYRLQKGSARRKPSLRAGCVRGLFGIGGLIAYQNLRRSRVKYRATVAAIVVSVSTFIALSTLLDLGFVISDTFFEAEEYQLMVAIGLSRDAYEEGIFENAKRLTALEGVKEAEVKRYCNSIYIANPVFSEKYLQDRHPDEEKAYVGIVSLGEEGFARYLKKLGLDAGEMKDKAVLAADYSIQYKEQGEWYTSQGMTFDYRPQDVITLFAGEDLEHAQTRFELTVACQTDVRPMCMSSSYAGNLLVVSDDWMDAHPQLLAGTVEVYFQCGDADLLEKEVEQNLLYPDYSLENRADDYRRERSIYLCVAIFLYGFITVIALIGVTNIFNTITTNMELRSREFAMLKSVGMTAKEFKRMIRLENLFYGGKALLVGIPLGWALSWGFYQGMGYRIERDFQIPWESTAISVWAVFILLVGIMHYSMKKVNRRNIIETIQNENI